MKLQNHAEKCEDRFFILRLRLEKYFDLRDFFTKSMVRYLTLICKKVFTVIFHNWAKIGPSPKVTLKGQVFHTVKVTFLKPITPIKINVNYERMGS